MVERYLSSLVRNLLIRMEILPMLNKLKVSFFLNIAFLLKQNGNMQLSLSMVSVNTTVSVDVKNILGLVAILVMENVV